MKSKYLSVVLLICLTNNFSTQAKLVKKGQVGFRFLENPVSAEAIGRGGLGLTLFQNSNTVFWNPSGLGWITTKLDFNGNYTNGIADINYNSFVGAVNFGRFGVVGVDFLSMDYGEFIGTRVAYNEQGYEETGTFQPTSYAVGLTYSKKVSDRFSFGVRSKYAYQDLGSVLTGSVIMGDTTISLKDYYRGEPAIDIGTTYDFLNHGIRFGAVMQNFSRKLKYEIEKFPIPFSVSFSLSLNLLSLLSIADETHSLVVGFETNHPRDYLEKIKIGAEYSYLQLLLLRTGYMGNYDERGLTFGMGIRKMVASTQIRLDYAYQDFGIFDATHTFFIGVSY